MKTNKTLLLMAATLAGVASPMIAAERVVEASELPPSARKAFDDSVRGETVKKIAVRNAGGRVVYDVELERDKAPNQRLRIAEDGTILGDTRKVLPPGDGAAPAPAVYPGYPPGYGYEPYQVPVLPRLRLEDLPQVVQETIRREAAERQIAAIREDTVDGRKAYVAEFREAGRNPRVHVAEDGDILRPTEKPPALTLGTTFAETPVAVQQAIRRELGDGEIVRIHKDKAARGEADSYKVDVKDGRGTYQIRVSADGRVLENTRGTARDPGRG